ncbi:MAG: tripartite tricarboxylate transporter TctB family protein [Candidatus Hodarchaeota archaeon]
MKKNDLIPGMIWMGLGIAVAVISYKLKLGTMDTPGPGLMPFLLGIILSICSLPILIRSFLVIKRNENLSGENIWAGVEFKRLILVLASVLGYIMLLEKIGFELTAFLLLLILFKITDSQKWRWALISSFITILLTFFLFVVFLKVELPSGLWRIR